MIRRALQRLPIASALLGLVVLVAVLSPGIGYLLQAGAFERAIGAEERHRADTVNGIATNLITSRGPKLYGITRALKFHAGLQEAFATYQKNGNAQPLSDLLDDLRRDTGLDLLQAVDLEGRVIYRAHDPVRKGGRDEDAGRVGALGESAAGDPPLSLEHGAHGTALRAAVGIARKGKPLGAISTGTLLGDALARQMADATGSQVSLASREGVLSSSLVPTERGAVDAQLVRRSLEIQTTVYASRDGQFTSYAPITLADDRLVLVIQSDAGAAAMIAAEGRRHLLLIAALALLPALLLGSLLAYAVTRPLRRLRARALEIAARHGAAPVAAAGNEIFDLQQAFGSMTDALERDRRRLELAHQAATAHSREMTRRENEARDLAMVASRTHSAVIITDANGLVLWVNEGFTRISGYTLAEVRGRKPGSLLQGPDTDAATVALIRERVAAGQGVHCEILNYAKDGRQYWLDMEVQPVLGGDGRIEKFMAIELDITDRKAKEHALRQAEEFLESVVENIPAMVFVKDARELRYQRINRAAERILGLPRGELVGKCDTDFFPAERANRYIAQDRIILSEPGAYEQALELQDDEFLTADGGLRLLRTRKIPIRDKDGVARYLLGISEDVTEQRAQERALQQAKEAAEAASLAKSQFLANMSHEIRTPMNGVLGMTELLLGTALSARQRRFAETVYRSGEALLEIINDILDFSKIEAGRLELQREAFCLPQLVGEVAELLRPRAAQKGIALTCAADPTLPPALLGDAGRIRQVLINLAGNAVKFTESGEVALRVTASATAAGACEARFSISDTGIGMPEEVQQRLFRVFEQGSSATTKRYGGTGLGLAISRHLVEMMGGQIGVRSTPGAGSTFEFTLPLTLAAAGAAPAAPGTLRGRRVLIVEDNPTNRGILIQQMGGWGIDCAAVDSGFAALDILRGAAAAGRPFEAALIDMKMPGMSGVELAERIKRAGDLAATRLGLLTSLSGPRELARARAAGIDLYLEKPVRQAELQQALGRLLGPRALEARQAQPAPPDAAQTRETMPATPPSTAPAHRGRVLVVEDNAVNREIACTMLEHAGCAYLVAENGREALAQLAAHSFDLVLMDCQMPEMDGYEAVRRVRAGEVLPQCATSMPVIALTANALTGDRERCIDVGFDDYLSKPFSETDLRAVLLRWLPSEVAAPVAHPMPVGALATTPAPPLDPRILDRLQAMEKKGAHGLMARLTHAFLASAPPLFDELKQATARGDMPAARHAAHTLKSSNANVGALGVSRLFAQIEADARRSEASAAAARLREAEPEFARVLAALRNLAPA